MGPWWSSCSYFWPRRGGEYGLGIIGYIAAWELLVARDASWPTRARALLPALVATLIYAIAHAGLGYGTFGAEVYADPIHMPRGWWKWAKLRIPKLAAGALWAVPSATIHVFRHPAAAWWYERWPSETARELHESHALFGLLGVGLAARALGLARFGLHGDERRLLRAMLLAGVVTLSVSDTRAALASVLEWMKTAEGVAEDLRTHRPTLEDVFVSLTGKHLRDE